jgi:hypothetical protein
MHTILRRATVLLVIATAWGLSASRAAHGCDGSGKSGMGAKAGMNNAFMANRMAAAMMANQMKQMNQMNQAGKSGFGNFSGGGQAFGGKGMGGKGMGGKAMGGKAMGGFSGGKQGGGKAGFKK